MKRPPLFARWLNPIVETLKQLGSAARARDITASVIEIGATPEDLTPRGLLRVKNQIHWARYYLTRAGYLDGSQRGVWQLTAKGRNATLDAVAIQTMLRDVRRLPRVCPDVPPVKRPRVPEAYRDIFAVPNA